MSKLFDHSLNPVHTSNNVEATANFVACCFDNVAVLGNIVEATFDIVAFDIVAGVDGALVVNVHNIGVGRRLDPKALVF